MGNAPTKQDSHVSPGSKGSNRVGGGVGRSGNPPYHPGGFVHPNYPAAASASSAQQQQQQQHTAQQPSHQAVPKSEFPHSMGIDVSHQNQNQNQDVTMENSSNVNMNMSVQHLNLNSTELMSLDDDTVPTVFRWEHGGRQVYITGTFNGWSRQIPMHRSGNDFTYIHNLKRGKHAFKFIVDDEWRFAPDQPTVADIEGRINNFIDVSDFQAYTGDRHFEERTESFNNISSKSKSSSNSNTNSNTNAPMTTTSDGKIPSEGPSNMDTHNSAVKDREGFSNTMPDLDEYTKEPPPLPPHLRHIILNKPPQLSDTAALPVPQHVALNHLYCTAIKDNMMVLGITQRYKTKFVTTVYYSPCAG